MLDQQLGDLGLARVQQRVPQLRIGRAQVAVLEQHPHLRRAADGVAERVRVPHRGPALEQQLEARRVLGLDGVVDGLAVVGVRAAVEQQPRGLEIVGHAGGAVEDGHRAELVVVDLVRVRSTVEQQLDGPPDAGRARRRRAQERRVAGAGERLAAGARQVAARRAPGRGRARRRPPPRRRARAPRRARRGPARGRGRAAARRRRRARSSAAATSRARRSSRSPCEASTCATSAGHDGWPSSRATACWASASCGGRSSRSSARPGAGGAQQLLRPPPRLVEVDVHQRSPPWRWCSQPVRPRSIASGSSGGPATGDGPRVLPASQARSPGRATRSYGLAVPGERQLRLGKGGA